MDIFGANSKILLKCQKAVFAEVGTVYPYQICKKNEKIRSGSTSLGKIEKIRFSCERLAEYTVMNNLSPHTHHTHLRSS